MAMWVPSICCWVCCGKRRALPTVCWRRTDSLDELVCDILHRSVGTGVSGAAPSQGLTPRAKSAVELAVSEAARTGAGYIGTEHLLMGLLREGNNMALRILRTVGIDPRSCTVPW